VTESFEIVGHFEGMQNPGKFSRVQWEKIEIKVVDGWR